MILSQLIDDVADAPSVECRTIVVQVCVRARDASGFERVMICMAKEGGPARVT